MPGSQDQMRQSVTFVWEGVPKKRGPKKESISALIKRIDGLEELLKSEKTPTPPGSDVVATEINGSHAHNNGNCETCGSASSDLSPFSAFHEGGFAVNSTRDFPSVINAEGLVDIYFKYFHRNPYEILDEEVTRHKLRNNQLPKSILYAVCALSTRYSEQPGKGPSSHVSAETYVSWAHKEIEITGSSVEICQALLLLVTAFVAMGDGKKAYSTLSQAVGSAMALELYQCSDESNDNSRPENLMRRRLLWTCYVMNVFVSTWLERPSLIDDAIVKTTIPCPPQQSQSGWQSKNDYSAGADSEKACEEMVDPDYGLQKLVWAAYILSDANRYLLVTESTTQEAYGHRHKIRRDLDLWAADISRTPDNPSQLFDGPEANVLLECRVIYHLIHCLIYRPLLPLHLGEPAGAMMIQHWVAEATEIGFRHATAILELVDQTLQTKPHHLPPFISYCIFTAGTIHAHGVQYANDHKNQGLGIGLNSFNSSPLAAESFASSSELLNKGLQQLSVIGNDFESGRLYKQRLEELAKEHTNLSSKNAAGYVPSRSNKFFQRYSVELRQKVQGLHATEMPPTPTYSQPPESPEDNFGKMRFPAVTWSTSQSRGGVKIPFAPSRLSIGQPAVNNLGHSRSFSDTTSLNPSYSFGGTNHFSQRPLPVWPGFQDATPRQIITQDTPMLDPSSQLTSPVQQEQAAAASQGDWGGVKNFAGGDSMGYEVLPGSMTAGVPACQTGEELQGSFVQFQNFAVL
ncbi:fungal-specific transcription factor domain-containing protein [Colletotrichum zoysiae]|uniref:Fungal-specific transcription factor domain-containing protein n=1 Tax=Colletotrichum zoysiae TaxID=1216348 RepID=A0AAD9HBX4_9PEZI|nr:fungal-specific transcription factor domain-containing protein [Colletotrichum zoysiae]